MHQQLLDFFLSSSSSQTFYKNDTNFSSEISIYNYTNNSATQQTRHSVGQYFDFDDLEKFENNVRRMGGLRPSGPLH